MLTLLSSLRGLLTILHAYLIADFVHSKPPGRKMVSVTVTVKKMSSDFFPLQVTSDINVYASIFSDLGKFIKDTKWIVKFNISIFLSHIFYVVWVPCVLCVWKPPIWADLSLHPVVHSLHHTLYWVPQCLIFSPSLSDFNKWVFN